MHMNSSKNLLLATAGVLLLAMVPANATAAQRESLAQADVITPAITSSLKSKGNSLNPRIVKPYAKKILQDDSYTLNLENVPSDCTVGFKSSDTSILSVRKLSDTSCRYTGTGYGEAKIIAKVTRNNGFLFFEEKKVLHAKVNVAPHAASVMFQKSSRKITVGQKISLPLTIRPSISTEVPVFESQNRKIASINKKGVVTGRKKGKVYITTRIANGNIARCRITVTKKKKSTKKQSQKKQTLFQKGGKKNRS